MVEADNGHFNELMGALDLDDLGEIYFLATRDKAAVPALQISSEPWHASPLPLDPMFRTEKTSIVLSLTPMESLGQGMLNFFEGSVEAQVSKVRPGKAAIKADVFVGAAWCSIKARVYERTQHGDLLLELHRRSGDRCAFLAVFQQAAAFFAGRFGAVPAPGCPALTQLPFPCPPSAPPSLDVEHSPLLDLARAPDEGLNAEAAIFLGELEEESLGQLARGQAAEVLGELLQHRSLAVAFPVAKLLSRMARQPQTASALRDTGLLEAVRCRAQDLQTPPLLRRELSGALSCIAAR